MEGIEKSSFFITPLTDSSSRSFLRNNVPDYCMQFFDIADIALNEEGDIIFEEFLGYLTNPVSSEFSGYKFKTFGNKDSLINERRNYSFHDMINIVPNTEHNCGLNVGDIFLTLVNIYENTEWFLKLNALLSCFYINKFANYEFMVRNKKYIKKISKFTILDDDLLVKYNEQCNKVSNLYNFWTLLFNFIRNDNRKSSLMHIVYLTFLLNEPFTHNQLDIVTPDIFKINLSESIFNKINTTMYLDENFNTEYSFDDFLDIVVFDLYELVKKDFIIKRCKNCGKYFIPAIRSDEKYCYYDTGNGKTCKQIGYGNKVNNDNVLKTYRTIYKTQNARKQRNKKNIPDIISRFNKWSEYAKIELSRCQHGEITVDEMKTNISNDKWLKEGAINGDSDKKE